MTRRPMLPPVYKGPNHREDYLAALAKYGRPGLALKALCMSSEKLVEFRRDADFKKREQIAIDSLKDTMLWEMFDRALDGHPEEVVYQGKRAYERTPDGELITDDTGLPIPLVVRKHDPRWMMKALEHLFPESRLAISGLPDRIVIEYVDPRNQEETPSQDT